MPKKSRTVCTLSTANSTIAICHPQLRHIATACWAGLSPISLLRPTTFPLSHYEYCLPNSNDGADYVSILSSPLPFLVNVLSVILGRSTLLSMVGPLSEIFRCPRTHLIPGIERQEAMPVVQIGCLRPRHRSWSSRHCDLGPPLPDIGTHIVSGSEDNAIRVWNASIGQCVAGPFRGHTDAVNSVAYSPDGIHIAFDTLISVSSLIHSSSRVCTSRPRLRVLCSTIRLFWIASISDLSSIAAYRGLRSQPYPSPFTGTS